VLEKLGLRLWRRERPTLEDLAATDTFEFTGGDLWDGDDLVDRLDRDDWRVDRRTDAV
jgi:hypothetical protein